MGGRSIMGASVGLALASMAAAPARVYGADNIDRMLRQHGRSRQVGNSIADQPHEHKREIARRKRQAERNAERRRERYLADFGHKFRNSAPGNIGKSRRGGIVFL